MNMNTQLSSNLVLFVLLLQSILTTSCGPIAPDTITGQEDVSQEASVATATVATTPTPNPAEEQFDGEHAFMHLDAQMSFGPRPTGSEAHRAVGDYILDALVAENWSVETQSFAYAGVEGRNLIARMGEGDGAPIILGAHYDTRLRADQDAVNPSAPVPGANDGASGVAVLLELARVLDVSQTRSEVWLAFFDAEDNGRLDGWEWIVGSRYFVENLTVMPQYAIIVDMVGDSDQDIYYERNSDVALQEYIWGIADSLGYSDTFFAEYRHSMLDDHTPFLEQGIPAVDIIDFDYPYWHTVEDTIDKVSADSLERVGRTLEKFLESGGEYPGAAPN